MTVRHLKRYLEDFNDDTVVYIRPTKSYYVESISDIDVCEINGIGDFADCEAVLIIGSRQVGTV